MHVLLVPLSHLPPSHLFYELYQVSVTACHLIYINDLASVLDSSLPILIADNTNLFEIGNNFQEMSKKIIAELENIVDWLRVNKLSINYPIYDF